MGMGRVLFIWAQKERTAEIMTLVCCFETQVDMAKGINLTNPALADIRGRMPGSFMLESSHMQLGCVYISWYLSIYSLLKIISVEGKYHNICINIILK